MSFSKDKASSYEVVTLDSSDDESNLFYNTPPRRREAKSQQETNKKLDKVPQQEPIVKEVNKNIASIFLPTKSKTKRSSSDRSSSREALKMSGEHKAKKSKTTAASSRVRPESSQPKIKLPKHLPTDEDYVFTRKERIEVQGNSKVMTLSQNEKDVLIAQRLNQVMGETMDQPNMSKTKPKHPTSKLGASAGVSRNLKNYVEKGAPLWSCAESGDATVVRPKTKAPSEGKRKSKPKNKTVEKEVVECISSGDEAIILVSEKLSPKTTFPAGKSGKNLLRSCSLSPRRRTPPRSSPQFVGTPMLDYSTIDTPILKAELNRYGLKPFPRSKAKKILRYIYKETHRAQPDHNRN